MNPPGRMNINDFVWVRLTDRGREIDRKKHDELRAIAPTIGPYVPTAKGRWSRWQLWQVMHRFGEHCYLGCDPPFDTEIALVDPEGGS